MTSTILLLSAVFAVTAQAPNDAELAKTPPRVIPASSPEYPARSSRKVEMVSGITVAPSGRLWAIWYAGKTPGEDKNNYVVIATSNDDGKTWTEKFVIDPDGEGPLRAYDPVPWIDPTGKLWMFWAQTVGHAGEIAWTWAVTTDRPDEENPSWTEPRRLTEGVMMNKPIVLSSGEWLFPTSTWRKTDNSARAVVSRDHGATFTLAGAVNVPVADRNFDEHMIVERKDGSLWMLVRTKYGIGESVSTDKGKTWTPLAPSAIKHTVSRFFIQRLASGRLLLVKHGPISEQTKRSHLTAYLSDDDGRTWKGGLLLDPREGCSYPDGQQAADGRIFITHDYSRTRQKEILYSVFTEADVLAGKPVSGKTVLFGLINKEPGYQAFQPPPASETDKNGDGAPFSNSPAARLAANPDYLFARIKPNQTLFNDRKYAWKEVPPVLAGRRFVQWKMDGGSFSVTQEGMVYVATPQPSRNADNVTATLKAAGFEKVNLPEFLLFDLKGRSNNLCSLYQKKMAAGEELQLGKWCIVIADAP